MTKICTSIEQSKKLLELGLDPSTADMFWDTLLSKNPECHINNHSYADDYNEEYTVPAWSLTALLELIPHTIKDDFSKCIFQMSKYDKCYQIGYVREGNHYCATWTCCEELVVDSAFEMVCWLIEQKYIKVNK